MYLSQCWAWEGSRHQLLMYCFSKIPSPTPSNLGVLHSAVIQIPLGEFRLLSACETLSENLSQLYKNVLLTSKSLFKRQCYDCCLFPTILRESRECRYIQATEREMKITYFLYAHLPDLVLHLLSANFNHGLGLLKECSWRGVLHHPFHLHCCWMSRIEVRGRLYSAGLTLLQSRSELLLSHEHKSMYLGEISVGWT